MLPSFLKPSTAVVPVVPLSGLILPASTGLRRGGLNLTGMSRLLDRAFTMKRAKAVALLVNSAGGSPVQSALIASRIRYLAQKNDMPVLSFVEDIAASGGYWLACSGDRIIAGAASIIGSIGVISAGFGFDKALARLGVDRRVHVSGERKGMLDPFLPESADDIAHLRALQEDIHSQFIAMVKARRGSRLKGSDDDLFSGAFWTGRKALEFGLIDEIGDIRPVLEAQFGEGVELRLMQSRRSLFGFGGGGIGAHGGDEIADSILLRLEERLSLMRYGL